MKHGWILPLLLIGGLIAFPAETSAAASHAALLWWSRVLPALLPYLIAASLLERSGVFLRVPKRLLPLSLFLCGALGGYPVGAKLARALSDRKVLSEADAQLVAQRTDLPNPVFLLTVVSIGFFGDARCAFPLLIGVYAATLLFALPLLRVSANRLKDEPFGLKPDDLGGGVADGVRTIGVIGGCLIFASVLGALAEAFGLYRALHSLLHVPEAPVRAVLSGLFEMTCGIENAASLPVSLPLRLAFAAFFAQFGGLSVTLQVHAQVPLRLARYVWVKLAAGALSALIAFLLTPLFLPDAIAPAFADAAGMKQNAFSLFSVTVAAAVGLLFVFVLTARFPKRKSARVPKNTGAVEP